ncbi:MAG: hypothetical protein K6G27_06305 [Lachnospiraceae bacterium]|nr:hypothetical protein [Lachnospiraceae bacterium]
MARDAGLTTSGDKEVYKYYALSLAQTDVKRKNRKMRKITVMIIINLLLFLGMTGCGSKAENHKSPVADNKDYVQEREKPKKEETAEKTGESKEEKASHKDNTDQNSDEDKKKHKPLTEAECRAEIELLRENDPVLPPMTELLAEMARCVTFSRILDEHGMIFSQMDNDRKAFLRSQIIDDVMWGETAFGGALPIEDSEDRYDADKLIPVDDAIEFFRDVYGEENYKPARYEQVKDGYILISYGDGDPWHIVEHMQIFEDEDYYLLTGPAFYEDNGGTISFLGYADILFEKNGESRYGVTLLYGRYRNEKIRVSSVNTSSELPAANGKTYSGMNLIDGDYTTIWADGVPGTGVGETITLHLDNEQSVYGIQICNGYTAGYDLYCKNGVLTDVSVDFGKGNIKEGSMEGYAYEGSTPKDLADCNRNKVELDEPVMTDTITITITGAKKGEKYEDTCVSEIQVY